MNSSEFNSNLLSAVADCVREHYDSSNLGSISYFRGRPAPEELSEAQPVDVSQLDEFFDELMQGGPGWIHAHIVRKANSTLVCLTRGEPVGCERFNLNLTWTTA